MKTFVKVAVCHSTNPNYWVPKKMAQKVKSIVHVAIKMGLLQPPILR